MGKPQEDGDNPHSDASRLLEAALQQMDGIISGNFSSLSGSPSSNSLVVEGGVERGRDAKGAAERLVTLLQADPVLPPPPDPHTANILRLWIQQPTTELEEQLRKLDSERESLSLQVAVLSDQVEAQSEKILDLERIVAEQKRQIANSEDLLQREILSRSSLETQKLELLALLSEAKRATAALEREACELRGALAEERRRNKPPIAPRGHLQSTPNNSHVMGRGISPSPSPVNQSPRKTEIDTTDSTPLRMGSAEQYRSLPRDATVSHLDGSAPLKRAVVFGRPTATSVNQPRCSSVPNLAETETIITEDAYSSDNSPSMQTSASKGIRKIFGKMKRSGSGNLDELPGSEEFIRGGVRSTAGPRLCSTSPSPSIQPPPQPPAWKERPIMEWSTDDVCDWLRDLGLDSSAIEARRWVKSGSSLLSASPQEIDKELNIKGGLIRKKVHLTLAAERGGLSDPLVGPARRLEPAWVLRWLDDIGLPQYKREFAANRIDGHVLHRLTLDDLASMHVTSALHVASIRAAIHVLRKQQFDAHCLIRRSDPENDAEECDERVELWTNHRVMEWLRVVDLAEYAPNLRGSGVHGAVMVHEERFTDTLLASILSIPPEKSLLRRHLSTHFKQLVGTETMQAKRAAEASLGYIPLTLTAKVKVPKKSQFTLKRKKSKYDLDDGELVCPLNESSKSYTGDSSPELGKSPNHMAASPKSVDSLQDAAKKESEKISNV